MIAALIKLADRFDSEGKTHLSSRVDQILMVLAAGLHGEVGVFDLLKNLPGAKDALQQAITFELLVEPDSKGGNTVKAIPKINDKWTDGLNLGDLSSVPKLEKFLSEEGRQQLYSDLPMLEEHEFDYTPTRKDKGDLDKALEQAYKMWEREEVVQPGARSEEAQKLYELHQQKLQSLEKARKRKELNQGVAGATEAIEQNQFIQPEEVARMQQTRAEVISRLVKMADRFDQEGKFELAAKIDKTLKSYSARPKAPLKKLDDEVKKNLILFIHDADKNTSKSTKGLNELFRRLRYFDLADTVKDMGLDRVVKDMERTQECLDGAKKRFYELMHGKKPSKQDLEALFKALDEKEEQSALDFFSKHQPAYDDQESQDDGNYVPEDDEEYLRFLNEDVVPVAGKWSPKSKDLEEDVDGGTEEGAGEDDDLEGFFDEDETEEVE